MDEEENIKNNDGILKDSNMENINLQEDDKVSNEDYENNECVKNEGCNEKNSIKKYIVIISCITMGIIILFILFINSIVMNYEDLVYPGNKIYGKDISKLTRAEVSNEINSVEARLENKKIIIKAEDKQYTINSEDIISGYNDDDLVEEIINSGKDQGMLKKYFNIVRKRGNDYKLDIEIEEERIKEILKDISIELNKDPIEPYINIEGENIEYKEGSNGIKVQEEILMRSIKKELINLAKEGNRKIEIIVPFGSVKPKINIESLTKVNTKISQYSTYYGGGSGRGTNIEIAAQKLDNLVLMPGEEFSYENRVGPVVSSNGYKEASVIINGKIQNGIGGGVCQVSSTLYNAQLKAGILPTQRRNHSKAVDYVPRGLDATLASGSIDYRFKNTYEYPLVINTYTSNGNLYTEIWSNDDATKGIFYEAVSYVSGKKADSYLYGYDKSGNKVYEKFIDTSIYN